MGVSPFLYTNIQHISAKSKCPPSGLEISLFLIFYTWHPLSQNSEKICAAWSHAKAQSFAKRLRSSAVSACNNFHTELKVAVRTCEGKAIHRNTQKSLHVFARIYSYFLSHEWARTEGRASQFTLMPSGVELSHADGADLRGTTCGAKFCVFLCEKISRKGAKGAKRYVLLFLCQKYCTQITQNHADALRNFAPLREKKICPFVLMSKKIFHTGLTEYTEFLLRNSIYFFVNRLNCTE